jgi:hypothetical protein
MDKILQRFSERNSMSSTFLAVLALAVAFIIPAFPTSDSQGGNQTVNTPLLVIGIIIAVIAILVLVLTLSKKLDNEIPSIPRTVECSNEIWGLWWTGDRHLKLFKKPEYIKKYTRILLPDFVNGKREFSVIAKRARINEKSFIILIKNFTKFAIDSEVPIKWYTKLQVYSLTVYDPDTLGEWITKQDLDFEQKRENRRLKRFRAVEVDEQLNFNKYKKEFNDLWFDDKTTRVPKREECLYK